jgi:hypothetical protein
MVFGAELAEGTYPLTVIAIYCRARASATLVTVL